MMHAKQQNIDHMTAVARSSLEASIVATLASQPMWVIKTRMLLNVDKSINQWQNLKRSVQQVMHQHGIQGYFRGLGLSLLLCFNGFVQMYTYEACKLIYEQNIHLRPVLSDQILFLDSRKFNIPETSFGEKAFICGGLGKIVSVYASHPLTTIRTRVQQNQYICGEDPKYHNVRQIVIRMTREEGIRGFYKGMWANLLKGIPQRGMYFYCYEMFKNLLRVESYKY